MEKDDKNKRSNGNNGKKQEKKTHKKEKDSKKEDHKAKEIYQNTKEEERYLSKHKLTKGLPKVTIRKLDREEVRNQQDHQTMDINESDATEGDESEDENTTQARKGKTSHRLSKANKNIKRFFDLEAKVNKNSDEESSSSSESAVETDDEAIKKVEKKTKGKLNFMVSIKMTL